MIKPFWPLAINTWGDAERAAAHRVIDSGSITMGEEVEAFEREFATYIGSKHAVMVNSGSSANLLAVAVMRESLHWPLNHGYEAVVPAIAWATTYAPLHQHGFSLRVMDVDPDTLNVSADGIQKDVMPRTALIVACSVLGNPAPVDEIRRLADERGLFFIEDNCESMGAKIGDKFCGTFGHIGTFSTFFSHHISTGEGGILVTDDDDLYELALCMRAHGWSRNLPAHGWSRNLPTGSSLRVRPEIPGDYQFLLPGYNLRPTEIAAAVGRAQLRRLDEMNSIRRDNATLFITLFGSNPRWQIQEVHAGANYKRVPFGFTLVFNNASVRSMAKQQLQEAGIEHRMITGGCFSEHPAQAHYTWSSRGMLTRARHAHHCGLFVGNHPVDLVEQIEKMAEVLR